MLKIIVNILKFAMVFLLFWFLNNGFLIQPIWLILQAIFFTVVTIIMFKYTKVKLVYWVYLVGILYAASAVLEIFKIPTFPEIMASSGFGVLVILVISCLLVRRD